MLLAFCAAGPLLAQEGADADAGRIRVVPAENVRLDYAQVLRVEPIYQTLHATRIEERCESTPVIQVQAPPGEDQQPGVLSRVVESVRGLFADGQADASGKEGAGTVAVRELPVPGEGCRLVQVERRFQRPIAYDVDYVYKGAKYRSRLAEDPGNRLRVRVSVAPWVADAQAAAAP